MIRLILSIILFLLSLLTIMPVPAVQLWYTGVAVTEFSWVFMIIVLLLLVWNARGAAFKKPVLVFSLLALFLFSTPIWRAYLMGTRLDDRIEAAFGVKTSDLKNFHQSTPFSFATLFAGNGTKFITPRDYEYTVHTGVPLSLKVFAAPQPGKHPCLVVVHGGSWTRGDNNELPDVNNYFANAGYQVATINYRLAPAYHSPAPQEDLHAAIAWLRQHAEELNIDTNNFVLMGRSAGGQIVLTAAYTFNDPAIKGVISFYGPTDMIWSYDNPANKWIYDSKQVLRDFFGAAPSEMRANYIAGSPMDHVTPATVPTLLVQGKNDAHVWLVQAQRLQEVLNKNKVRNMLLALPWATHGCEYSLKSPSGQLSVYSVERFLYAVTK